MTSQTFGRIRVPSASGKLRDWLKQIFRIRRAEAASRLQKEHATERVVEAAGVLAKRYRTLVTGRDEIVDRIATVRRKLTALWVQQGLAKAEGITISPTSEFWLGADDVLALLPPEVAAQVVRQVPSFDLEAFLALADKDPTLQALVTKHLKIAFDVEMKRTS